MLSREDIDIISDRGLLAEAIRNDGFQQWEEVVTQIEEFYNDEEIEVNPVIIRWMLRHSDNPQDYIMVAGRYPSIIRYIAQATDKIRRQHLIEMLKRGMYDSLVELHDAGFQLDMDEIYKTIDGNWSDSFDYIRHVAKTPDVWNEFNPRYVDDEFIDMVVDLVPDWVVL